MEILSKILIAFIAILHLYFLWLEMFVWTTRAKKVFKGYPDDFFEKSKTLAANQGLYNGFLAAGLFWSLLINNPVEADHIAYFFLGCVFVAGVYGAVTAQKKILFVQALPAALGILLLIFK
jgi:putative membrane protein